MKVWLLCFLLLVRVASSATILLNTSSACVTYSAPCFFDDASIWSDATIPTETDDVVVRGGGAKKKIELCVDSEVTVKSITLTTNVVLSVRKNGIFNTSTIAWRAPSTVQVTGHLYAQSGVWSQDTTGNLNNGTLIVSSGGNFIIEDSTEVGNATINDGGVVQMLNFKVFDTLTVLGSRLTARFIDAANIYTNDTSIIVVTSLFVGQYARLSGSVATGGLSSVDTGHIDFVNATGTVTSLEIYSLCINSSNITLAATKSLPTINITNSNVAFATNNTNVAFTNVILTSANITMLSSIDLCNVQINSNSTINGNVRVTCGISFIVPSLLVNGNYTQIANTYINVSTSMNSMNYTYLKVMGSIDIESADLYKDIPVPGVNSTIRLGQSLPGQLTANVDTIYDPWLAVGLVDAISIDQTKGRIWLVPTKPSVKNHYFYEDWRFITAAVLLTVLAISVFVVAKKLRRTRELDERLLLEGEKDKRRDSDDEEEEEDEGEEMAGMGDRRLSFKIDD